MNLLIVAHACYLYLPAEQGLARHITLIALVLLLLLLELTDDDCDGAILSAFCRSLKFVRHEK